MKTSSGVTPSTSAAYPSAMIIRSRWKCIVPLGSPVEPEVNPIKATSSDAVSTAFRLTGLSRARRSSSASWFAVPSNPTTVFSHLLCLAQEVISSMSLVSQRACVISAFSTYFRSSPARSRGIVLTTTAPTFVAASQQATIAGLLADRIRTRFPGSTLRSSTSACARRLVQSVSSL